jgi:tetratricopeptide (TPR) repeat protein
MRKHAKFSPPPGDAALRQLRAALLLVLLLCVCGDMCFGQAQVAGSAAARAIQAQTAGKNDDALRLYSEALRQSPGWADGWWRYGGLLYESKQYAAAEQAFGRLTQLAPDNSLGFALLGLCEFEQGDWNNASLHLNKALNHGNLPAGIAQVSTFDLGLVHLHLNNRDGAIMAFKILLHQAPDYPDLALALGAAEINLSSLPQVQDSQFAPALLAGKAAVAVLKDQSTEAEKLYRQLIVEYPSQPFAHLCLGLFLEGEHRDNEAADELAAETKLNPKSATAWLWLGRVALVQQDPEMARSAAARAQALEPDNPVVFLVEGRSYILEHRWEQALAPLQEAEKRAPQSSAVHFALASAYTALHRTEAAKQERQLFLQSSPSDDGEEGSAVQ